jgi:hypothetical protein
MVAPLRTAENIVEARMVCWGSVCLKNGQIMIKSKWMGFESIATQRCIQTENEHIRSRIEVDERDRC